LANQPSGKGRLHGRDGAPDDFLTGYFYHYLIILVANGIDVFLVDC